MAEALPVEQEGPLTSVETRGIEPRTSCLQTRGTSVFVVAERLRGATGEPHARLVLGRCRTFLEYGPLRPDASWLPRSPLAMLVRREGFWLGEDRRTTSRPESEDVRGALLS